MAMLQTITLRRLALAAALAVLGAASASADPRDPTTDNSGYIALGLDISNTGNTPETVAAFFDALPKARQRSLVYSCRSIREAPAFANPNVLRFCGILVSITAKVPPAPPPPRWGY
jgi:hypothetical protein